MSNYPVFYGYCTFAFLHMSIRFIFPGIISQFWKFLFKITIILPWHSKETLLFRGKLVTKEPMV